MLGVDLDGTLHQGDLAFICAVKLCLTKPWLLPALLFWMLEGRLALKLKLARHIRLNMGKLDWNKEVINFLRRQSDKGQQLVLATGAVEALAAQAAVYLKAEHKLEFTKVLCASEHVNVIGAAKADLLARLADDLGGSFDYIGDSPKQDPPVFERARVCHFVNPTTEMLKRFQSDESEVFHTPDSWASRLRRCLLAYIH